MKLRFLKRQENRHYDRILRSLKGIKDMHDYWTRIGIIKVQIEEREKNKFLSQNH